MDKTRFVVGVLVAPLVPATIWTLPAIGNSAFAQWMFLNLIGAYTVVVPLVCSVHLILKAAGRERLRDYLSVVFLTGFLLDFAYSIWKLQGFESRYYFMTDVVVNGQVTAGGYLLEGVLGLIAGTVAAIAMAVFWLVAVRGRTPNKTLQPTAESGG